MVEEKDKQTEIEELFEAGAHFAYSKSRRHPSASKYIFGSKSRTEIFDLEATSSALSAARDFVKSLAAAGKTILFVSGKAESKELVKETAEKLGMPYVSGRFVGGTLTNFSQIKKRVERLQKLLGEKESGELVRYTKKERLLIDREIERLSKDFGGITNLSGTPSALVVIDPKHESIAVTESSIMHVPVVALANSDCDLTKVTYPVPGNDSLGKSISYFLKAIASSFLEGRK